MCRISFLLLALVVGGHSLLRRNVMPPRRSLNEPNSTNTDPVENAMDVNDVIKPRTSCTCGFKNTAKIIGGEYVTPNEYPWMVALCYRRLSSRSTFCGGSLINDRYVLTAAHCILKLKASDVIVSLGDHNLDSTSETDSEEYQVSEIISHSYNTETYQNDIALLKLTTTVTMRGNIRPICLPPSNAGKYDGEIVHVTGWGDTIGNKTFSKILKEVALKVVTYKMCTILHSTKQVTNNNICTKEYAADTCMGDSGGPLVYEDPNGYYEQIGIVSWGMGCGGFFPSVFTRVSNYVAWINWKTEDATYCTHPSPN